MMPREGIFAKVIEGGELRPGEGIVLLKNTLIHAAVLTVSDKGSRGEREDTSGDALEKALRELGAAAVERAIVPDEADQIAAELRRWADETAVNLVLTTGGTGMTSRDVTPEATLSVLERQAPGFAEAMRAGSLADDAARDALARGERHPRQDAHRQHAGQPARLSRAVRDDRRGPAARGREAAGPGRRLRGALVARRLTRPRSSRGPGGSERGSELSR